jgi:hypothetical protein
MLIQLIAVLGVALAVAVVVWRGRVRRLNCRGPEARYRRDIQALKHRRPGSGQRAQL